MRSEISPAASLASIEAVGVTLDRLNRTDELVSTAARMVLGTAVRAALED